MDLDKYSIISDSIHLTYEFLSEGPNGTIKKVVLYQEIEHKIFNLAFGDWDELRQKIDDTIKSNNNDRDKVLATVASTVIDFMKHHPRAVLFAKGSTAARTRLYQIGILKNWKDINQLFDISGFSSDNRELFEPGKNYQAFYLKAK